MIGVRRAQLHADWSGLLLITVAVAVGLSLLTEQFTAGFNIYVLMFNIALAVVVAYGQMVVVATGGMNIALGATGGLSAVIMAGLMESYGVPLPVVIVVGLAAGALMGFINGFLTIKTGINPFVITLAMASAYTGLNMAVTSANPYYNISPTLVEWGQARTEILPHPAIVTVVVALVLATLFHRLVLGRNILAVGGNARASEMTGVPVERVIVSAHVLSGFLAALAGLLTMARLGNGTPTIGSDWLLPAFAALIIGGVPLEGGKVAVMGVVFGVAILELITNALAINRIDPYWVTLLQGTLILAAVGIGLLRSESTRSRIRGSLGRSSARAS
ncbi:MAG TPA: ABC transporter permease [Vicinamibacterales bacterium]|jgi:ribose transport system permease protein